MEKRAAAWEARRNFGKILREVADKENSYVIERHGEAVAAMVPIYVYDAWVESRRGEAMRIMQQAQQNASMTDEEAQILVAEEIVAYRAEKRSQQEAIA